MIQRDIQKKILSLSKKFKAVAIVGPRQSGKTTLAKMLFKDKPYISLENIDHRTVAKEDTRRFLKQFPKGAILDEVQRAPEIFSYLQEILDNSRKNGQFILTGSQNFLLQQDISQSLAGRVAYATLLPLSVKELSAANLLRKDVNDVLWRGFYPAVYQTRPNPTDWYANYVRTYIERDVRQIRNIENLSAFGKFMRMCAINTGQLLNLSAIGNELGVDQKTVKAWLNVLESSYIIFLLQPYFSNPRKRLVKTPKLYFYDTGLAAYLLGLRSKKDVSNYYGRGSLFENLVIAEFMKDDFNFGKHQQFYFWRDKTGNEIDLMAERGVQPTLIEIKSADTFHPSMLRGISYYTALHRSRAKALLIYNGEVNQKLKGNISVTNWRQVEY
ncbi:MAG: ATP-binding protein [Chitinophagales bacterium]|nr:ATP-binding protein [Chitinophagales bacterium]MDW8419657.1 ATP-binding protein [Chitinophagales bacterium]